MVAVWLRGLFGISPRNRTASSDPRKEARRTVNHPVKVHVDGRLVECRTINLSASGALVDTALETTVGSTVQIQADQLPRLVAARVARIGAHSTAIRFQSIDLGASLVASITAEDARANASSRTAGRSARSVRTGSSGR